MREAAARFKVGKTALHMALNANADDHDAAKYPVLIPFPHARRLEFLCVIRRVFELGALELPLPFKNSAVFFSNSQCAVEIDFVRGPLQQAGVFEPFDVGQIAQTVATQKPPGIFLS